MEDEVEQIKERLNIEDVISNYLTLKKAGANLKANCPFHNEKTPSFMISPERQTFKCFGCGEGGDIFTFIEKMEGIDFYNALKILADKAGVTLRQKSVKYGQKEFKSDKKTTLFEINDWAKKLYHKILLEHPKAKKARDYLNKRGMSGATIKEFEIGYAPDSWDLLIKFLEKKNYKADDAVQAGLAIRSERGKIYDRFRGRIMFPINNIMGSTVAFTSRILEEKNDAAKYINSAESPIYTKGSTIYGLDRAKMAIKEFDKAVFVEGNMDVIACHQAGFKNVVATSGTAITEKQMTILSRYAQEIIFSFDNDDAGFAAMKKAVQIALKNDINAKVVWLDGPFKDPDEAIKADPKNWQRAVERAKPALEHWIDSLVRKNPELEIITKKKIAKEILPVIKTIYSEIEKEYYVKYLAKKLSITEKAIFDALEKTKVDNDRRVEQTEKIDDGYLDLDPKDRIAGLVWCYPSLLDKYQEVSDYLSSEQELSKIFNEIKNKSDSKKVDAEIATKLEQLAIVVKEGVENEEIALEELKFLVGRLKLDKRDGIKQNYAQKIKKAEEAGDRVMLKRLLDEFSSLIK